MLNPLRKAAASVWSLLLLCGCGGSEAKNVLKPGDMIPDFQMTGTDGRVYTRADLLGKTTVIAWYPQADTPGCTAECKSLTTEGALLRKYDLRYFGASLDTVEANRAFAEKYALDYPLLSDPTRAAAVAFGVAANASTWWADRATFIIAPDGKILHIERNVNTANHARQIADQLAKLYPPAQL